MSKRILFISAEKVLFETASIFLNIGKNDTECFLAESVSEAISCLESDEFDLIFMGHKITVDDPVSELNKALVANVKKTSALIFGTNKALAKQDFATYFSALIPISKILFDIFNTLELEAAKGMDYISFPLDSLRRFQEFPFDCYVKIKKAGEDNYLHLFRQREVIDYNDIEKLKAKGAKEIFASFSQMKKRVDELSHILKGSLSEDLMANPEEAHEMAAKYSFEILKDSGLDISDEVFKRNEDAYLQTKELVKVSPGKKDLKKLLDTGGDLYYKHVSMTSLICCYILDELKIKDKGYRYKLCNAAYFQNIYLNNDEELIVESSKELEGFSVDDQKRISEHALMAFELLSKNPLVDSDVLRIVREQHGDKRGIGFPEMMSSTNKVSLIFQLATSFSLRYLVQYEEFGQTDSSQIFDFIAKKLEAKDKQILDSFHKVTTGEDLTS